MNYNALIISTLAGLSTFIGYLFIFVRCNENNIIPCTLGFSAGIMLYISIFDLLPQSYNFYSLKFNINYSYILIIMFLLLGFIISYLLNNIIKGDNSLYRIGIISLIILMIHNIPEGLITYLTSTITLKVGILLAISIACHNIPEGISIAIPIYISTKSKVKTFLLVLVSAIAEPIGALIAATFFSNNLSYTMIAILLSLVAGIMINVAIFDILREAYKYSFKKTTFSLIVGILLATISHLLL